MKLRILILAALCGALIAGFGVGHFRSRAHVVVYSVPGPQESVQVAVHADWPTYGLPLAEYLLLLEKLRDSDTETVVRQLDGLLDMALHDAFYRREHLSGEARARLDRAIEAVAQYRLAHPRTNEATWTGWAERADELLAQERASQGSK